MTAKCMGWFDTKSGCLGVFIGLLITGLVVGMRVLMFLDSGEHKDGANFNNSNAAAATSPSGSYRYAAVAASAAECSTIGVDILGKKGSAVDAAIATMLCVGVASCQSSGIGGGHFMTIYDYPNNGSKERVMNTILARERAPLLATRYMFQNDTMLSRKGALSIGVPGEIKGFHTAWKKFGKVTWKELFQPVINMCRHGYRINSALCAAISRNEETIRTDPELRDLFVKADGTLYKEGDILKRPKLADTLSKIAEDPEAYYNPNSQLAKDIVADITEHGGIISISDLESYCVYDKDPIRTHLSKANVSLYSPKPPSSGAILQYILSILDGYNFEHKDYHHKDSRVLSYHRIAEAFKFAFAKRSELGDEDFVNVTQLLGKLTCPHYASNTRTKIHDNHTHSVEHYEPAFDVLEDSGTAHASVFGPDGTAVAITSTINFSFGSKIRGSRTGILFNNQMDDFSTPGTVNGYGVPASPANYIVPGKMMMSSMSPTIVLGPDGEVKYISGAAGGTRIITATAWVMIHTLLFKHEVGKATDIPRMHHQLMPHYIVIEPGFCEEILQGLIGIGHKVSPVPRSIAVAQSIHNRCHGRAHNVFRDKCIDAVSDKRSAGVPDGF